MGQTEKQKENQRASGHKNSAGYGRHAVARCEMKQTRLTQYNAQRQTTTAAENKQAASDNERARQMFTSTSTARPEPRDPRRRPCETTLCSAPFLSLFLRGNTDRKGTTNTTRVCHSATTRDTGAGAASTSPRCSRRRMRCVNSWPPEVGEPYIEDALSTCSRVVIGG